MDEDWSVQESKTEYENEWYTGGYDLVRQPDGTEKRYYWAEIEPAVIIVARKGDRLIFVEQYRPAVEKTFPELPAGLVEAGEDYCAAARRELVEETGYRAGRTELLQEYHAVTGLLRHRRGIVFATDLEETEREPEQSEFLKLKTVPVDKAVETVRQQPADDAAITGLLVARDESLI